MHFDDRLATVLRLRASGRRAAMTQFRQLIDLLGERSEGGDPALETAAYLRLIALGEEIPTTERVALVAEHGWRFRNPDLVKWFGEEHPHIAAAALARAQLRPEEWVELIPSLPIRARGFLRHRGDLPPAAVRVLDHLGVADRALPRPEPVAEAEDRQAPPQPSLAPAAKDPARVLPVRDINTDDFSLALLHTNDTHASLDNAPKRATAIKERRAAYRAEGTPSLLLDAGDVFSGSLYFNEFKGQADLKLMNYMKYDMMTFGNHEFDLGAKDQGAALQAFVAGADFPFITANVDFSKNPLFNGMQKKTITSGPEDGRIYQGVIKKINGEEVGFFGLTTEETVDISSPGTVAFSNYIKSAQATVDKFKARGINKIVALTHIGYDDNPAVDNDQLLAQNVDGIDVIVGGHTHSKLLQPTYVPVDPEVNPKKTEPTIIVQAYQYSEFLGDVNMTFDYKGKLKSYKGSLIDVKAQAPDAGAAEILKPYADKISAIKNQEIGVEVLTALPNLRTNPDNTISVRNSETALGNLITDGMLAKAKTLNPDTVIAVQNSGGIRAAIDAGPLTTGEILTTLPFGNTLATVKLSGAELKQLFESSVGLFPLENGGFLQVSGMKLEYDGSKAKGERVTKMTITKDGGVEEVVDPAKMYVVATNAFSATGADGLTAFKTAYDDGRFTDLGLSDWETFRDYAISKKTIDYKIEGRILNVDPALQGK